MPKPYVRLARPGDIDDLLAVELDRYGELHDLVDTDRDELKERFEKRLSVALEWSWVAEISGAIVGWTSSQPTNMPLEAFSSWEQATDNGTLEGTYDEAGESVYVVNLDVTSEGTAQGAQHLLMAAIGAKATKEGRRRVIFECRMPGLRDWLRDERGDVWEAWPDMPGERRMAVAEEYAELRVQDGDRVVRYDRLLRFFESSGFRLHQVIADAFRDPESMDFGVLCTGDNMVPEPLRRYSAARAIGAWLFLQAPRYPRLFDLIVR